jgi:hypothetical protein
MIDDRFYATSATSHPPATQEEAWLGSPTLQRWSTDAHLNRSDELDERETCDVSGGANLVESVEQLRWPKARLKEATTEIVPRKVREVSSSMRLSMSGRRREGSFRISLLLWGVS